MAAIGGAAAGPSEYAPSSWRCQSLGFSAAILQNSMPTDCVRSAEA